MPRRARRPLLVVAVLALVPAVALGALVGFARGQVPHQPTTGTEVTSAPVQLPALAAPLLSLRRAPDPLATDLRADTLVAAAASLLGSVDGGSCAALAVDDLPVAGQNSGLAVVPASTLKVVVAAVAVEVLGAGHTFTTDVRGPAPVGGVVEGDLYLVGGGDPVLSEAWYTQPSASRKRPPLHATSVEALADALVAAGVTQVTGRVLGDGSRYDDERYPPGWGDDIAGTLDGPPVGALVVNDSVSSSGTIADDPAASAAAVLTRLLRDRGVTVGGDGRAAPAPAPAGLPVLASATSATLAELVHELLATSDNLTAEMLVKEIGLTVTGNGTRVDGLRVVSDRLLEWGIPMEGVTLDDGSGLSRANRLTCTAMLAVLRRGSASDVVGAGLALAGQDGTTLAGQLADVGITGVLQAKTGSLTGVKALCGYFVAGGDEVAFVLVLNGGTASDYAARWSLLTDALLVAASSPTADALAPGGAAVG